MILFDVLLLLIILATTCLLASMGVQVKYDHQLHSAVELSHTTC